MSPGWIIAVGLLALLLLLFWLRGRPAAQPRAGPFQIDYDDRSITVTDGFGESHTVQWDELEKVAIRTADDGPVGAGVVWGLQTRSSDHVLIFPEGAAGEAELVSEMTRRLPGFDSNEVIHAMGTTSNGLFVVWQKVPLPSSPAMDPGNA
jgi:YD repeat-containing protein